MTDSLKALAKRASKGDKVAFRALLEATYERVFRLALYKLGSRTEAEDVVQETYMRAWKQLPRLRDPDASLGWLFQITRNTAADHLRKRNQSNLETVEDLRLELIDRTATPEQAMIDRQGIEYLLSLVAELKDEYRIVLLMRDVDGLSYREIATQLGIPKGTVESRLYRARRFVAEGLRRARRSEAREA